MIRKMALGFVIFLVICAGVYLRWHRPKPPLGTAYASESDMTLWNSSAQVRSPIATTVNYGDPLLMLQRFGSQVQVRTPEGTVGWASEDDLISPEIWQKEKDLSAGTAQAPVEARGRTRVISNLRLGAGRDAPRIRQLKKDVPVEMFLRQAVPVPAETTNAAVPSPAEDAEVGGEASSDAPEEPKKEDWWLVRAQLDAKTSIYGWVLGRFVDLDVPDPLLNNASAAGLRIVAWFELNHVVDSTGQIRPQYLLVGATGPEGQACDFTLLRVYTWSKKNSRYETAFVQSDVCGRLPVQITQEGEGETAFSFTDPGDATQKSYRMRQTIVRRVDAGGSGGRKAGR